MEPGSAKSVMTDVTIYKKIEVTIIRPSEGYVWVEKETAQAHSGMTCLPSRPEQALLCSVKGGVGVSGTLLRLCAYQSS